MHTEAGAVLVEVSELEGRPAHTLRSASSSKVDSCRHNALHPETTSRRLLQRPTLLPRVGTFLPALFCTNTACQSRASSGYRLVRVAHRVGGRLRVNMLKGMPKTSDAISAMEARSRQYPGACQDRDVTTGVTLSVHSIAYRH